MARKKHRRRKQSAGEYIQNNFVPAVLANAPKTPGVFTIEVRHDDWCKLIRRTGPCNCNPEVCDPKPIIHPREGRSPR